jgi:hypothetical protein
MCARAVLEALDMHIHILGMRKLGMRKLDMHMYTHMGDCYLIAGGLLSDCYLIAI